MNLWYSSYLTFLTKIVSVSEVFWKLKSRRSWNSNRRYRNTTSLKRRDKLKADIAAQARNLREADGSIKQFIQEDLRNLDEKLRETERQLSKLDEGRKNNMIAIRDLEMTKERLLSFAECVKDAQPEVLVTLIQIIVERIYTMEKDNERYCHIFIKGCSGEDYTSFFRIVGYTEDNPTSVCDLEQCYIYTKV